MTTVTSKEILENEDQNYFDLLSSIGRAVDKFPSSGWRDALSENQFASKLWLKQQLEKYVPETQLIMILGGWYGILAYILLHHSKIKFDRIHSFDLNSEANQIADLVNIKAVINNWKFKACLANWHDLNYSQTKYSSRRLIDSIVRERTDSFKLIINTCCEHVDGFAHWYGSIPEGKVLALQSNDFYECSGHVNCAATLDEFVAMAPMKKVYYSGALKTNVCNRWMIIGEK